MMKRILLIGLLFFCLLIPMTVSAASTGFDFKEIIWDDGWIWVLMMAMGIAAIFDFIRQIIINSRGGKPSGDDETGKPRKPSFEILIRRRIE